MNASKDDTIVVQTTAGEVNLPAELFTLPREVTRRGIQTWLPPEAVYVSHRYQEGDDK